MNSKSKRWQSYIIEFFIVFLGISLAFALERWTEERRNRAAEAKILQEIKNGLEQDLLDIEDNKRGHRAGLKAVAYLRRLLLEQTTNADSLPFAIHWALRDYVSIQNRTGYEALKSRGLELVQDDSIRIKIIYLYDFGYEILEKLEEDYAEMQYNKMYFDDIARLLSRSMTYGRLGEKVQVQMPLLLNDEEKKRLLMYLYRIEGNRKYMVGQYDATKEKVEELLQQLSEERE
jgi:hypothetical protein